MGESEFDTYAADYENLHRNNISISGEAPEFFADYKMRDFKALACEMQLPLDGRYLDFGSGIGASVRPFLNYFAHAKLVCADVSAHSLGLAQERSLGAVEYSLIAGETLPFADASFDGAFACCVFHHIPQERHLASLLELRRVLKPGALLMLYEHNPFNPLTVRSVRTCEFDENAVLITARKLARSCLDSGFRVSRVDYRVFFPAALARLRPLEKWLRWLPLGAQYYVAVRV